MAEPPVPPKVLYVAFDACDAGILQRMAADGRCPTIARLLEDGAVLETTAPYGTFVGSSWMTISTGTDPGTHRYWNWREVDPATYEWRDTTPRESRRAPFWQHLSDAGRRVAVFDVPHADVPDAFNGVIVKEWGCHDRHFGPASSPPELLPELESMVGTHFGAQPSPRGNDAFAPCDYVARGDLGNTTVRSLAEEVEFRDMLLTGLRRKLAASHVLLDRGPWDLFMTVLGESHCVGHQFWHVHDRAHPRHDPVAREVLGDPLADVYARLDANLGDLLAGVGDDTVVWFQCNHGMGPHYDGAHLLDEVLFRIDRVLGGAQAGWRTRSAGFVVGRARGRARTVAELGVARAVRARYRRREPAVDPPRGPGPGRRFFQIEGNTAVGAVRFNVAGREAVGGLAGDEYLELRSQVAAALMELVNVDTGRNAIVRVVPAENVLSKSTDDGLPDLFVEWDRSAPLARVWSPRIGTVAGEYDAWRTGDHVDGGLVVVRGAGVEPGRRRRPIRLTDVAPTICATLGAPLPESDGEVRSDLIPPTALLRAAQSAIVAEAERDRIAAEANWFRERVVHVERQQLIATTTAWVSGIELPEEALVSVILPTYHRPEKLRRAIASVLAQRYQNWELLVVDDGSDTAKPIVAEFGDDRIVHIDSDHAGAAAARNVALDMLTGELVAYLDDDNTLEPLWLKAVVWAFSERAEYNVLYGARTFDDIDRAHGRPAGGMPFVQFEPWNRVRLERENFTDMGVIAHRAGLPAARFDEQLWECADWDLLLALTEHEDPLELPVTALRYYTDGSDRLTGQYPAHFDRVREKWAGRGSAVC